MTISASEGMGTWFVIPSVNGCINECCRDRIFILNGRSCEQVEYWMGTDDHGNLQRISLLGRGLHVAPEMTSTSHVKSIPNLVDDLDSSEAHVDRVWGERISCDRQTSSDVAPESGMRAVT